MVLRAVEEQFRATGYAGTSLDDVAAATGLGRGSIYAAFGDKHELFMRSLSEYCERNEASVAAALDGPDDTALERLHAFLLAQATSLSVTFGVVAVALNRVGHTSKGRLQKRRTGYAHRAFKDVM